MRTKSMVLSAALSVALGGAAAGCGARLLPLQNQGAVMIATPQQDAEVRGAIARALVARHFTVEQEQPNKIIARLDSRGTSLRLNIDYSGTQFNIGYLDSQGYNYQVGPQGPMIGRGYANNVEGLRRSIQEELGRPAREAQAAVDAQREHELAMAESQRRAQQDSLDAQAAERERERQANLEVERLRTRRAEAQRPIIVGHESVNVQGLAFNVQTVSRARGAVRLNPGFTPDPRVMTGTAGGNVSADRLGMPQGCAGFYSGQASHQIVLAQDFQYLRIETSAPTDTTLAVVAPDGSVWCDDDGAGNQNARISGAFPAGPYRIYVGNFRQAVISPFELTVSEIDNGVQNVAQPVAQPEPAPEPPPDCRAALLAAGHHSAHMIHCEGAEPYCAVALLQAGHNPAHLIHCHNVDPTCAVNLLRAGRNPAELINCPQQ
jgi:hypothetical protein